MPKPTLLGHKRDFLSVYRYTYGHVGRAAKVVDVKKQRFLAYTLYAKYCIMSSDMRKP
jgi:hypothetical protein